MKYVVGKDGGGSDIGTILLIVIVLSGESRVVKGRRKCVVGDESAVEIGGEVGDVDEIIRGGRIVRVGWLHQSQNLLLFMMMLLLLLLCVLKHIRHCQPTVNHLSLYHCYLRLQRRHLQLSQFSVLLVSLFVSDSEDYFQIELSEIQLCIYIYVCVCNQYSILLIILLLASNPEVYRTRISDYSQIDVMNYRDDIED